MKNKGCRVERLLLSAFLATILAIAMAQNNNGQGNSQSSGKSSDVDNSDSVHSVISCGDKYPGSCKESRLRSIDGSCNNLKYPTWGMANTRYGRLVRPNYGDGIRSPTVSVTGSKLPASRLVSVAVFPHEPIDDKFLTLAAMQWGQIMTHDMSLADGSTQSTKHAVECCSPDGKIIPQESQSSLCYPILIEYNDPVYTKEKIQCLEFVRTLTDIDRGCSSSKAPAEQITAATHYLDLSLVYGSDEDTARSLRTGSGGRLAVDIRNNRHWLPSAANKSASCNSNGAQDVCYAAGDRRVNQNTQLTVLQIVLLREHNRVADFLAKLNPHWNDETIYQETRRILIAEHQHISYYEWLPLFLGEDDSYGYKLLYDTKDYVNDYDPEVNPSVLNEHATAAFRYFHSLIAGHLDLVNENRNYNIDNSLRLSNHFNHPVVIEQGNNMDDLVRGLSYQAQRDSDQYFDSEITQYLFKGRNKLGSDLRAIDIQRNRDHGLASYNDLRQFCNLPRAKNFTDFLDWISEDNVGLLQNLYATPDDVDLTVGGSLEIHLQGALSGPTFQCILVRQFLRTRSGDRFWFESGDPKVAFTKEQLGEIRKASISRLLCDNGDNIQYMQPSGFIQISKENFPIKCEDLPSVDLSYWKDFAPELAKSN